MRKYWTKARLKHSWANSKLCMSMSDVKMLFKSPTLFSFVNCNTLLSLVLVLLPVSSSPWQVSLYSDISNILGSPRQPRFQSHSFMQGPFYQAFIHRHVRHMPGLSSFLQLPRQIPYLFFRSLTLNQNHVAKAAKFCCFLGLELLQLCLH